MLLKSKAKVLPPAGTHTAVLYQLIDLGTQSVKTQWGEKDQRLVRLGWELSEELMDDGRPFAIAKRYNASASPKAVIVKDIKAWTGQNVANGFDLASLLGKACNLTISHDEGSDGTVYANVVALAPLKKSETPPAARNKLVHLDLDSFDQHVFDSLPDFLRDMISDSPEYDEAVNGGPKEPVRPAERNDYNDDQDIPF